MNKECVRMLLLTFSETFIVPCQCGFVVLLTLVSLPCPPAPDIVTISNLHIVHLLNLHLFRDYFA